MLVNFDSLLGTQSGNVIEGSYLFPTKVQAIGGLTYTRVPGTNYFTMD
jgi:hypothetical protein